MHMPRTPGAITLRDYLRDPHTYVIIALLVCWPLALLYAMWRQQVRATAKETENL